MSTGFLQFFAKNCRRTGWAGATAKREEEKRDQAGFFSWGWKSWGAAL